MFRRRHRLWARRVPSCPCGWVSVRTWEPKSVKSAPQLRPCNSNTISQPRHGTTRSDARIGHVWPGLRTMLSCEEQMYSPTQRHRLRKVRGTRSACDLTCHQVFSSTQAMSGTRSSSQTTCASRLGLTDFQTGRQHRDAYGYAGICNQWFFHGRSSGEHSDDGNIRHTIIDGVTHKPR